MAAEKYLKLNLTTGRAEQAQATQAGGPGQGGKIVALDDQGLIPTSMLSGSEGAGTVSCVADVNLAAGDYVNIFFTGGQRRARKATATDHTIPAHGYVKDTISATTSGLVYLDGLNTAYPRGSFADTDTGKRVFLATAAGTVTVTPPSSAGNLIQNVGTIVTVDTTSNVIWIDTELSDGIVV